MITIRIKTDNAAFQDGNYWNELERILDHMAKDCINHGELKHKYHDINGNSVATIETE